MWEEKSKNVWIILFNSNKRGCDTDAIGANDYFMDGCVNSHTNFNSKPFKKVDFHVN